MGHRATPSCPLYPLGPVTHTSYIHLLIRHMIQQTLTYFIATPPYRGWQRSEGRLLLTENICLMSFTIIFEAVEVVENNEGTVFRPNPNPNKPDL